MTPVTLANIAGTEASFSPERVSKTKIIYVRRRRTHVYRTIRSAQNQQVRFYQYQCVFKPSYRTIAACSPPGVYAMACSTV